LVRLTTPPKDIVIVSGEPVGVEFASVFTALGIPATLVSQSDPLLPEVDSELAGLLSGGFERRGVSLVLGSSAVGVSRVDGWLAVRPTRRASGSRRLASGSMLAGRTSSTATIGRLLEGFTRPVIWSSQRSTRQR
jgi:pyruvate/2-oxoglutarate dehydrogenase complex dihydrolipoamide dehydrogenase (E3) component